MTAMQPRSGGLDVARIRRDFPIFSRPVQGKRLVFLDSAASAQKPRSVIDAFIGELIAAVESEPARQYFRQAFDGWLSKGGHP